MSTSLRLPQRVREAIAAHARGGHPEEICGLLAGTYEGDVRAVQWRIAIDNAHPERRGDRYELDPKQHLQAQKRARAEGLELVGVYHSHPDADAVPSDTDAARAREIWGAHPSWSYLIVSVTAHELRALRSWRLEQERFVEQRVEIEDERGAAGGR